jgi:hypothetical protein
MSKKIRYKYAPVDPSLAFIDMSEEDMHTFWKAWYPGGSGPLSAMRQICALVENVAHLRGFDVTKWREEYL